MLTLSLPSRAVLELVIVAMSSYSYRRANMQTD